MVPEAALGKQVDGKARAIQGIKKLATDMVLEVVLETAIVVS